MKDNSIYYDDDHLMMLLLLIVFEVIASLIEDIVICNLMYPLLFHNAFLFVVDYVSSQ